MIPEWLSLIDVLIAGIVLLFSIGGFQRGFAGQVAHVLSLVMMGITLYFAYPALFRYFSGVLRDVDETYLMWTIIGGVLVSVLLIYLVLNRILAGLLKSQLSDHSDRGLGFLLGLVRGALFAVLALLILVMVGPVSMQDHLSENSSIGRWVCVEVVPRVQPHFDKETLGGKLQGMRERLLERQGEGFSP